MNDIFVPHIDIPTSKKLIEIAKNHGYDFFGTYKNKDVGYIINDFYKYNHKNNKIIWNFYYNEITKCFEITVGSKTIFNSYPHLKPIILTYYFGGVDIFNYV